MKNPTIAIDTTIRNTRFAAFVCVTLGFLLLEACFFRLGARPVTYVTSVLVGITIAALVWRRMVLNDAAGIKRALGGGFQKHSASLRSVNVASALLLVSIGYLGANALLSDWTMPVCAFVLCLYLFPWSRIPLCRRRLLVPNVMLSLGAAAHLYWAPRLASTISLLISVWLLWTIATCCWLRLIFLRQQKLEAGRSALQTPAEHSEGTLHG